jgi:hypothetical protein
MDVADIDLCMDDVRNGRVYSFKVIVGMLRCSNTAIWRLFRKEPGVIRFNRVYRVPETVLRRVLNEMSNALVHGNHR